MAQSTIYSNGGFVFDTGTGVADSDTGEADITFHRTFNTPPTVYFTTTGTSKTMVWGIKCKAAPTTTGFTAVCVKNYKSGDAFINAAGGATFQWLAVGT